MTNPTQGRYRGEYGDGEHGHTRQTVNKVGENDKNAKKQALTHCFLSILATVTVLMASMAILANESGRRRTLGAAAAVGCRALLTLGLPRCLG